MLFTYFWQKPPCVKCNPPCVTSNVNILFLVSHALLQTESENVLVCSALDNHMKSCRRAPWSVSHHSWNRYVLNVFHFCETGTLLEHIKHHAPPNDTKRKSLVARSATFQLRHSIDSGSTAAHLTKMSELLRGLVRGSKDGVSGRCCEKKPEKGSWSRLTSSRSKPLHCKDIAANPSLLAVPTQGLRGESFSAFLALPQ